MTTRQQHEYSTQIVEVDGPIGYLTLNRPARLNAINDELMREMIEALSWLDAHPEPRVVILRGAGRAFSAGADLKEIPGGASRLESGNSWLYRRRFGQIGRPCSILFRICRRSRLPRCTARRLVAVSC
jgi:enoyl-CoA hydratase/carnithine racemase